MPVFHCPYNHNHWGKYPRNKEITHIKFVSVFFHFMTQDTLEKKNNEWMVRDMFFLYDIIFWLLLKIILQRSLSEGLIHFKRAINKNETFYFFIRFWYQILIRLHYYTFAKILKIKWIFIFSLEKLICMFFTSSLLSSPKSGPNLMQNLNSSILSLHLGVKFPFKWGWYV